MLAPPPDMTNEFNTQLTPVEEAAFQAWAQKTGRARDTFDYDLRGAWKADAQAATNGHLPDTWKKPIIRPSQPIASITASTAIREESGYSAGVGGSSRPARTTSRTWGTMPSASTSSTSSLMQF